MFSKIIFLLEGIKSSNYFGNVAELSVERTEKLYKAHNGKMCEVQQSRSRKHNYKLSCLEYNKVDKKYKD